MSLQFMQNALLNKNVQAFLHTVRISENGTDDCYNFIFGSSVDNDIRFTDFSKHPDIKVPYGNTFSTAAGAYQFLYFVWVPIQRKYNLPDFSPPSQDIGACELISERNVLEKLMNGEFNEVVEECCKTWASLPGLNGYNQPQHDIAIVTDWYTQAGGQIT